MKETEADTRANRIDPVLRDAGWGGTDGSQVSREYVITQGRITQAGRINPIKADYVLCLKQSVAFSRRAELRFTSARRNPALFD